MSRTLAYSSQHKTNPLIPDGTIITVAPSVSSGSSGSSGITPAETADFTTITDALTSLKNKTLLGTVTIQVADGTYNEPSLFFADPELSGRLIITGNIYNPSACVINTIPDPNFGFKLSAYGGNTSLINIGNVTQQDQIDYDGGYGLDYSTTSYGLYITNGFLLRMGGFTIQGSLNNGSNVTRSLAYLTHGGQLYCPDSSMILTTGINGIHVSRNCMVFMRYGIINNCIGDSINATFHAIVCLDGGTLTGPGANYAGFSITDPKTAFIYSPNYVLGTPVSSYPIQTDFGSLVYLDNSSVSGYPNGATVVDSSFLYIPGSTISNIADTQGCLRAYMGASILADTCSFNNVSLPLSGSSAFVSVNSTVSATSIVRGVSVSGATLSAEGSNAVIGSVPTPYSPNSNGVTVGDGSLLSYS